MTEQQPYELVQRYPHFELRHYPTHVLAEVQVNASFDRAGNAAFRYLFNYISGNNAARQSVAMTAPVVQGLGPSQKLAMTAPVLQSGSLTSAEGAAEFVVAFVLPAGMTAETAPVPSDPKVRIRTVPGSFVAAKVFFGGGSKGAFEQRNLELQAALTNAGLRAVGLPRFARFDPPFKPWFLRHNEVLQDAEHPRAGAGAGGETPGETPG
ncbi:SOUL family heme-binding protein [Arthrobacter sp. H16F315]|uniref:SOUL family heme-binding protein n=1 Tax=Arthrobacter sp. H16F315 TaxID=2955314 RepID=UPI0020977161|nr:heme-binding protein [Arthrobacter sp. H16F315]MDD1475534.1 heme-binding protein [Arthrobacter sp. H16F315]